MFGIDLKFKFNIGNKLFNDVFSTGSTFKTIVYTAKTWNRSIILYGKLQKKKIVLRNYKISKIVYGLIESTSTIVSLF